MSTPPPNPQPKTLTDWVIALKHQDEKARALGFYWQNEGQILDQIISECAEIRSASLSSNQIHHQEEVGDLLHGVLGLCFYHNMTLEELLQDAHAKFQERLLALETEMAHRGLKTLDGLSFDDMKHLWARAKKSVTHCE